MHALIRKNRSNAFCVDRILTYYATKHYTRYSVRIESALELAMKRFYNGLTSTLAFGWCKEHSVSTKCQYVDASKTKQRIRFRPNTHN